MPLNRISEMPKIRLLFTSSFCVQSVQYKQNCIKFDKVIMAIFMDRCTLQVADNNGNFQNATNQSPNRNQTEFEKIILTKYTFLLGDGVTSQKEANNRTF